MPTINGYLKIWHNSFFVQHIEEYNADGVDVSYSDAATDQDKKLFGAFLDELHATLVPTTRLFVTVNPQTSYANRYDVDALQRYAVSTFIFLLKSKDQKEMNIASVIFL